MNRVLWRVGCGVAVMAAVAVCNMRPAYALKEFREQFVAKYVKADSSADWKGKVDGAKCCVCHFADKPKEERNVYGQALAKLLNEKDKKNKQKIAAALEKVAGLKAKADDAKAPTFGELIKQGNLPATGQ